jgi:hypothetical protein
MGMEESEESGSKLERVMTVAAAGETSRRRFPTVRRMLLGRAIVGVCCL